MTLVYFYFYNLIKIHPKCKIKSAFNRKKIPELNYRLNLTKGGLFFNYRYENTFFLMNIKCNIKRGFFIFFN